MAMGKLSKYWGLIIVLLVAAIATGSVFAWSKRDRSYPIEISMPSGQEVQGEIQVTGAVANPGIYSIKDGDSIADIIQAAGGAASDADLSRTKLYIPEMGEEGQPQKIDVNRADAWLLQALPGIGETLAQRIIDYRQQNGAFKNINELVQVEGIGIATYDKIKHLITVAD